jgi:hypothetical protein
MGNAKFREARREDLIPPFVKMAGGLHGEPD